MTSIKIALLGSPQIIIAGRTTDDFDYAKIAALFVFLTVEQQRAHSRDALAELLWPDQPATVGRTSLRQALARLRQIIADSAADPPRLLVTRETVRFNPACDHLLDTVQFAQLIAVAETHGHTALEHCAPCMAALTEAVGLYRGPFADTYPPRDADAYEEWVHVQREWYAQRQISALARLADAHAARAEPAQALIYARRVLELDPWREPTHRQIMRLLAAQGERGAALAQYERCRQLLADELGVEPEEATRALAAQIRAGTPASVAPPPPPVVSAAAPLPTALPSLVPAPLPSQSTSFIGRAAELQALTALLARPECRLLTLLGPGGAGKTRLALRLSELVAAHYADGVAWVALAGVPAADAFADALARALGCAADDTGDPAARVREALAARRLLLILDNFEPIISAAAAVQELLAAAPHLTVLITSRERLNLQAEWVYDVGGLALPAAADEAAARNADALQLFADRLAQAGATLGTADDLAAAIQIARLVEGNPLALELAAAARRAQSLPAVAAAIAADLDVLRVRLRDVPERHRSVRAAIAYSWNLLDGGERRTLALLSVFRDGFTDAAATAVAAATPDDLAGLADKSLLRRADSRSKLHELVRRFAAEQLAITGQLTAARAAHLEWCVAYAEAAEPHLTGATQQAWVERLEAENANLRAALAWAIETAQVEAALRLSAALVRFWWMHGHVREGRRWLDQALALAGGSPAARARALHASGSLAGQMGDLPAALRLMEQSLVLERTLGRAGELVRVLNNLAFLYVNQADYAPAEALLAEALELDRAHGDAHGVAFDYGSLAQIAYFRGEYTRAVELWIASLAGHRQAGDSHSVAVTLMNLGAARRFQGDPAAARSALDESLTCFRALGSAFGLAHTLLQLARLAYAAGDHAAAQAHLAESLPLFAAMGVSGELAGALALYARMALDAGQVRRSARLWGAAMTLLDERGASLQPPDLLEFGQALAAARLHAAGPVWDTGWAEGRALALEAAVAEALRTHAPAEL